MILITREPLIRWCGIFIKKNANVISFFYRNKHTQRRENEVLTQKQILTNN